MPNQLLVTSHVQQEAHQGNSARDASSATAKQSCEPKTQCDCRAYRSNNYHKKKSDMYFKIKLFTGQCLAALLTVVPAAVNSNTNTRALDDVGEQVSSQFKNHASAWVTSAGLHPNTDVLVNAIAASESHGLSGERYQLNRLQQVIESFVENSEQSDSYNYVSDTPLRTQLEQNLNTVFASFARDLGSGVLDAQATQKGLHRAPPKVDTDALLARLQSGDSTVRELLLELAPSSPDYTKLVDHMKVLLEERDSGARRTRVSFIKGLKLHEQHSSIINLRTRLLETGDLNAYSRVSSFFDEDIADALTTFQKRHGLPSTGELTESTVVALNASVDDDIEQVAMNLERWRWMPRELGDRHIMVNVPSYNLTMMNGDQRIADMAVVVGSKEHHTPIFSQAAKFVEVAPTWTVPASITNNELIPLELRRPGYLKSEKIDFFRWEGKKLKSVPRSQVSEADFHKKPFPYVLRQRAGAGNALGGIKILMPNKFAVYMHDTQAKNLFAKTDRAYSHGCIRLSDPFRLGSLLLQLDGKTPEQTTAILDKKKTTRIKLNNETPTHISYFTAWVDDDGKLNTRKDVYKNNKKLISALHENNTLLSTLKSRSVNVLAEQVEL